MKTKSFLFGSIAMLAGLLCSHGHLEGGAQNLKAARKANVAPAEFNIFKKSCCKKNRLKPARQLTILLTNDDGISSNLLVLWEELTSRGHKVYGFVPVTTRTSGAGEGILAGAYTIAPYDSINFPNLYRVSAAPNAFTTFPSCAECVELGMSWMEIRDLPIDLVVSGPNAGNNIGPILGISGTNGGAAYSASGLTPPPYLNTPAICISLASIRSPERRALTACFTANLIEHLDTHRNKCDRLLPKGVFLNVNVPSVDPINYEENCGTDRSEPPIKGVVLTTTGLYFDAFPTFDNQRKFIEAWPDFNVTGLIDGVTPFGPVYGATNFLNNERFPTGFSGELVLADPFDANTPLINNVTGKIVLVQGGGCFASTKAENVGAAGGIGMVLVNNVVASFGASSAQEHEIPSITMVTADATPLITALQGGSTVELTFNDFVENDGSIIYYNGSDSCAAFVSKNNLDKSYSETNALANGYITITPQSNDATFGVTKDLKCLCRLLKPVLTQGPSICKSKNKTSPLLENCLNRSTKIPSKKTVRNDNPKTNAHGKEMNGFQKGPTM